MIGMDQLAPKSWELERPGAGAGHLVPFVAWRVLDVPSDLRIIRSENHRHGSGHRQTMNPWTLLIRIARLIRTLG